jgi:hypothetical protein
MAARVDPEVHERCPATLPRPLPLLLPLLLLLLKDLGVQVCQQEPAHHLSAALVPAKSPPLPGLLLLQQEQRQYLYLLAHPQMAVSPSPGPW